MEVPRLRDVDSHLISCLCLHLGLRLPQTRASLVLFPKKQNPFCVGELGRMSVKPKSTLPAGAGSAESLGFKHQIPNPLVLIPAPSWFLSSVSLIPKLQYLILLGFLTSELKYFFTCIVDCKDMYFNLLCLPNYLACSVLSFF